MKISVITAVRNGRTSLPAMLASLRCQSHGNVEHIVQDGGSTDGTLNYLTIRACPGMRLASAPDGGIYDAINKGISRATGDVVGLLHADDCLADPQVLERISAAFDDPNVDGVYGDLEYTAQHDPQKVVRYWRAGAFVPASLRRGWMPPHPTLYLRRRVFEQDGGYDTSYRISGDYDGILRWLTSGRVRLTYIPQVLVRMRLGGTSNRSAAQLLLKSLEDYRAIRRYRVGGIGTLLAKNLCKLPQFIQRG